MNCGSLVYATQQGLGILAKSFHDAGIVTDVFVVEHSKHPTQWDWYPDAPHCSIRDLARHSRDLRSFVDAMDVLLCFETPFYWPIVDYAKSRGVKTVMMPMYECSLTNPPATFDEYWCPSLLDLRYFSNTPERIGDAKTVEPFSTTFRCGRSLSTFTPVPVEVEWRQRTEAKVFVHNAGHGGLKGRNGTRELLQAMDYVKSDARLILRSQGPLPDRMNTVYPKTTIQEGTLDDPWRDGGLGDVFIFPEKFNGLSLPLQEARAAGMLVMATDRYPMNQWLPTFVEYQDGQESFVPLTSNPLILIDDYKKNRIGPPYMEFDEAVVNPRDIAEKIDEWYGRDITAYSQSGREWAETMSWGVLGPKYKTLLEGLK